MSAHNALNADRLAPIYNLAEKREADAARVLAAAQQQLAEREHQLYELENYQEPAPGRGTAELQSAALLRNRELFRLRLAEAIRHQRIAIAESRARVEVARNAWLTQHRQTLVYEKLIQRGEEIEKKEQERYQQKELDELALRLVRAASETRTLDS